MLTSLNNLDFEINSMRGIDIANQFDNGKYAAQRNLYGMDINCGEKSPKYNRNRNINNEFSQRINLSQDISNQDRANIVKRNGMNKFK